MKNVICCIPCLFQINKRFFKIKSYKGNAMLVIHPVIRNVKGKNKSEKEIFLDAQEALGLARSAKFYVVPGCTIPEGGWKKEEDPSKEDKNGCKANDCSNRILYKEIERKITESVIVRAHQINYKFYFRKGKMSEISKHYLTNPTPYIFINTLLAPEQFRNLDFLFNSLLKTYQEDLKLESKMKKEKEAEWGQYYRLDPYEENEEEENNKKEEMANTNKYFLSEEDIKTRELCFQQYNNYEMIEEEEEEGEEKEEEEETYDDDDDDDNETYGNDASNKDKCNKRKYVPKTVEIFDRYSIILYIFKMRARSNISKLQVELARAKFIFKTYSEESKSRKKYMAYIQNNVLTKSCIDYEEKYNKMNVLDWTKNGKYNTNLGFTSTYIKHDETYKEYENRIINGLFNKLKKELLQCKNNTYLQNNARKHKGLIAVVGYTNVGKTKLINYLTKSNLKAKNILFQTLDTAYKSVHISEGHSTIFVDSIGFIQDMPNSLYESFMHSLEAIKNANVILHIVDVSHPYKERHRQCVLNTLMDIGITEDFMKNQMIEVWNKVDMLNEEELMNMYKKKPKEVLPVSAYDGTNCNVLIQIIQAVINKIKNVQVLDLKFKTEEAKERIEFLSTHYQIVPNSISYSEDGNDTFIKIVENQKNLKKYFEKFGH